MHVNTSIVFVVDIPSVYVVAEDSILVTFLLLVSLSSAVFDIFIGNRKLSLVSISQSRTVKSPLKKFNIV